jgi:sugar/nucleoside kinase (ribokinase family)
MRERCGILAGGNWIVDRLKFIDTYPCQDALANILSESVANGGSPFNLLVDLAKLEPSFPLFAAGLIGADSDGEWIIRQCAALGIDTTQLRVQRAAHTSYTDVMTVRATGRRTFFHQRGANAFLEDAHFEFASSSARHFHLGYLLLLDRLDGADHEFGTMAARTLHRAQQAGLTTSIDLVSEDSDRFAPVVVPALRHVDYAFLNEFELERTTGLQVRAEEGIDIDALRAAVRRLLDSGVREWVIVHFPEGACALGRDGRLRLQSSVRIPQSQIVSAVGAGDAFAAGVLYALHEHAAIETALRYGVCVAAASLQEAGASDGVVPLQKCLQLEERYGTRSVDTRN